MGGEALAASGAVEPCTGRRQPRRRHALDTFGACHDDCESGAIRGSRPMLTFIRAGLAAALLALALVPAAAQTASSEALTTMESHMTWLATIAAIAKSAQIVPTLAR